MLVNFTNHPFDKWSDLQKETALSKYQIVKDIPFPHISPTADELDIKSEAIKYLELILDLKPDAVHIMGEMNFTFQMVYFLMKEGVECIASTTSRVVHKFSDGTQESVFNFVKFRSYNFLFEENIRLKNNGFSLSDEQQMAFELMKTFVLESNESNVFILKGYAGTGKTTLLKYFIEACLKEKRTLTLMASTGRAAAILKAKTRFNAKTVHSLIYKFDEVKATSEDAWSTSGDEKGQLYFNFTPCLISENDITDIYVIDEASMVSGFTNVEIDGTKFGSGNVLADFFKVVGDSKVIFVGDPCQLPPVDEASFSAALDKTFLEQKFQRKVEEIELTKVLRQGENSEVLEIATPLREQIVLNQIPEWPKLDLHYFFKDVKLFNSTESLIEKYISNH